MRVSQSFMKAFTRESDCRYRLKLAYIDGIRLPFDPDNVKARDKGHLFEALLLGDSSADSDIIKQWPKSAKGLPLADEKKVNDLAELAKVQMAANGVKIDQTQVVMKFKDLAGIADALGAVNGEQAIIDVKYTETKPDERWSDFGWGDPDKIDLTQARHYQLIHYLQTKEQLPFYFLVFSPYGGGWIKFFRVSFEPQAIKAHLERVQEFKASVKAEKWLPANDWNTCHGCELAQHCDKKTSKILISNL